jgi:nucleoside phosphorylase
MPQSYLLQYFSGVALKTLTAVEANTAASNQHEYNGNTELRGLFGKATAKHRFHARFVYVSDEKQERIEDEAPVTWYDARQNHPKRSEHRLYFPTTRVSRRATAGDLLVIGMLRDNSVLVVIAKDGSHIATDLRRLFSVTTTKDERFSVWQKGGGLQDDEARSLLQTIGVLDRAATHISSTGGKAAERTAIVVIGLPSDYEAVVSQLRDISEQVDEQGTLFEVGRFDSTVGIWEIAIVRVGLGTLYAASTVDKAIQRFLPEVVVLLGAAAGISDGIAVGDVVVASAIYSWDTRSIEPRNIERQATSHRVLQRAIKEASGSAWLAKRSQARDGGTPPKVVVAPIASTTNLVTASQALRASRAVAVDFEDAALLGAVDRRDGIEVFVIRGIANLGQTQKIDNTKLASGNATAFAFQVLSMLEPASVAERASTKPPIIRKDGPSSITRFRIRSIKSIEAVDWEVAAAISTGWHVLVGINASGKTTALRCIALALLGNSKETQVFEQNWAAWVRQGAARGDVIVTLTTGAEDSGEVGCRISAGTSEEVELTHLGPTNKPVFSVGYGPFRRFSGGDDVFKKRLTPRATRNITLFSERADLADSLRWLQSLYVKYLEDRENRLCFQVENFINKSGLLPRGTRLEKVSADRIVFKDGNECDISIEDLSDGFRSVLSLVLDILRHLTSDDESYLDPFSPDRANVVASGIVLIDEIDVHLHPKWQQEIGAWFRSHFPNFQFIVATHSLFVCQSADSVFILPDPGATGAGRMLTDVELNQIRYGTVLDGFATGVFGQGVDESDGSRRLTQELATLNLKQLREGLSTVERSRQAQLRAILPTSDILPDSAVEE